MKNKKEKISRLEQFFSKEVGIEVKACLYFACILTYYFGFRIIMGSWEASIIHMIEMISTTYIMGYIQFFLLSNFDEMDEFNWKVVVFSLLCSLVYMIMAIVFHWFDGNVVANVGYFVFMVVCYFCYFVIIKVKKSIDTRILNEELKAFQERKDS